jgi:hypothetical protein
VGRRNQQLMQITVAIVAEHGPYKGVDLLKRLQHEYGVSQKVAGETLLYLIHDGLLKQTVTGKIVLRRAR